MNFPYDSPRWFTIFIKKGISQRALSTTYIRVPLDSCAHIEPLCMYLMRICVCVRIFALGGIALLLASEGEHMAARWLCFSLFMPMLQAGWLCVCVFAGEHSALAPNSNAGFQSTQPYSGGSLIRQAIQMSPAIHFILKRWCSRREIRQTLSLNESIGEITSPVGFNLHLSAATANWRTRVRQRQKTHKAV